MQSFLLISKNYVKQQDYLNNFIKEHRISTFDVTRISESSIGIEVIRKLLQSVSFKPYSGKEKIIIIENAQNLTTEAQNAALKLLEEPPIFLNIFLCSNSEDAFLPTIISRCKIITLEKPLTTSGEGEDREKVFSIEQNLETIINGSIGEKLALAEKLSSDKEKLLQWFEEIMFFIREKMLKNINDNKETSICANILQSLHGANKTFSTTNVSPRTILEHIFLEVSARG